MDDHPATSGSPTPPPRRLHTTDETAQILGMRPRWLLNAAKRGDIPVVRCGRSVRFDIHDIEAYIAAHKTTGVPSSDGVDQEGRG